MTRKASTLVATLNSQQAMNIDAYLEKVKDTVSLFFSDDSYFMYDETSLEYDEITKLQKENAIKARIQDLGVLDNYADFGVVYADNHTVGWISTESYQMFDDGKTYEGFSSKITDEKTESGWFADKNSRFSSIYYVKRLNENAVLFTSFYTREIESIFEVPDDMENMVTRLIDENGIVIYSTDKSETGLPLPNEIESLTDESEKSLLISDDYMVTSDACNNGKWSIVCSVPKDALLKEIYKSRQYSYMFSLVLFVVMLGVVCLLIKFLSNPMGEMVSALEEKAVHDQLTGLLNKISFRDIATAVMEKGENTDIDVFIMLDMDNFKKINDTLGHDKGDEVIIRIGDLIKRIFGTNTISGRIGGDEFAVYRRISGKDMNGVKNSVASLIQLFKDEFDKEFVSEHESCGLSLSAGIVIMKKDEMSFEELYKTADNMLYRSKRNGKNQINFYE
jgi:diguanylate cyclase (GGDEF)-like protein